MKHVIIVGGGITGLSAAYHLQEEAKAAGMPITYTLLESDSRLGGKIKTVYADGFTIDGGPDCFLSRKPWAIQLCRKLGLGDELLGTNDDKRKTFVLNKGKLTPLPDGVLLVIPTRFVPFATSRLITWHGKMRMGMDLFIPPRKDDGDETVANFIRRRLGSEALEKIAEPLMSGIHISDPEYQSLLGSFPRFREMELKHGSLIRAMVSQRKPKGAHGSHGSSNGTNPLLHTGLRQITRMVGVPMPDKSATNGSSNSQPKPMSMFMTLRKGLGQFVNQLVDSLEGTLLTDKQAVSLELCSTNGHAPRYQVRTSDGETFEGDAVIMATPAYATATLMDGVNPALATELRKIRYVTTSTVSMGFRLEDVGKPFGGFGFVIPRKENRKITGCTWSSTKFSYRVPDNHLLLRAFIGGPGHEHLAEQEDDALVAMVRSELRDTMGLQATPVLTRVFRWTKANPQYDVGHLDRVSEMHASCESQPGLFITGSAYDGVGVPDCVNHGHKAAKKAIDLLKETSMVASAVEA